MEYGNENNLKDFVNVVTSLHKNSNKEVRLESHSVGLWSSIFQHCHKEKKTNELLKIVSEKSDILGGDADAVKTMLLHKIDGVPLLFKAVEWGEDIETIVSSSPIRKSRKFCCRHNSPRISLTKNSVCWIEL